MIRYFTYTYFLLLLTILAHARSGRRKGTPRPDPQEEAWTGKWFPYDPNVTATSTTKTKTSNSCDNVNNGISIDFDPTNKTHSYNYLCFGDRELYAPSIHREAVLTEHYIPPAFVSSVRCLNESISYEETIPTFGPHRLYAPKYGEYKYLPPQRWLQCLANGAIVMLYHPCAFHGQVKVLKNTVKGCLYRHIITPSQQLSPVRPLALLAWGKILQMSVVDEHAVVDFIKQNAKRGAPNTSQNEVLPTIWYQAGLIAEAHLITDEKDGEICAYKNM